MGSPLKVLVVDDSAMVRHVLSEGLAADPAFEVVGTAPDAYVARDKIVRFAPDVMTLDIEMPRMDGIEFVKRLMPQHPLPIVIVSALAEPGAAATLAALEHGAVDFVLKPTARLSSGADAMFEELKLKLRAAAAVDVSRWLKRRPNAGNGAVTAGLSRTTDKIVAIGASTGGTVALNQLLREFPADMPGTIIVQHMPPVFTRLFAERLD